MLYTKQELFDKVANHLLTQNAVSEDGKGNCMYRGEGGLKCAVGVLIPDQFYNSDMESLIVNPEGGIVANVLVQEAGVDKDHLRLLAKLQFLHDNVRVSKWRNQLAEIADDEGLVFNEEVVA